MCEPFAVVPCGPLPRDIRRRTVPALPRVSGPRSLAPWLLWLLVVQLGSWKVKATRVWIHHADARCCPRYGILVSPGCSFSHQKLGRNGRRQSGAMKIACLQFSPQVGDIDNNLNRADAVLNKANAEDLEGLDLLVLPELAFTGTYPSCRFSPHFHLPLFAPRPKPHSDIDKPVAGYSFKSLQHISPFLEHAGSGITSLWARTTALKHDCTVVVGYPEKVDVSPKWPTSPEYYNSALVVDSDGDTIANYRKSFLYYTDETWALEGGEGFFEDTIPGLGNVALGICTDLKYALRLSASLRPDDELTICSQPLQA